MLFVKVPASKGDRKVSAPFRRKNPFIEAYQRIFAGTRIATAGFAMATSQPGGSRATRPGRRKEAGLRDPRPDPQAGWLFADCHSGDIDR
jgi:hypothetical protein